MDLSVVIRCGDDDRLFRCIESIDEEVEIVVAHNSNKTLEEKLSKMNILSCVTPPNNLSVVSNLGAEKASYDKIIITDSDTWFEKGSIVKVYKTLAKSPIVNMRINFISTKKNASSIIISKARDFVNSLDVLYTPGIGIDKKIIPVIGGYLFDNDVPYAVDANFTYRIKKLNIPYINLESASIFHDSETLKHDLKAAYRIGKGCWISARKLLSQNYGKSIFVLFFSLKGVKPKNWKCLVKTKGCKVLFYQFIWDSFFYFGALVQCFFSKHRRSK